MKQYKLLVNEWFKTFSVMKVSPESYEQSPSIESCGTMTGFKIKDQADLTFRLKELNKLGFSEDKD